MKLTLTGAGDPYPYQDENGILIDTPAQYLWIEILGGCGCGTSDEISELAWTTLKYFATDQQETPRPRDFWEGDQALAKEILAHWIDSKDLIEHGGSVYGSWLSAKGSEVYDCLMQVEQYAKAHAQISKP